MIRNAGTIIRAPGLIRATSQRPSWGVGLERWLGGGGGAAATAMQGIDKQTASGKNEVDFFWDADLYTYAEFYGWGMKGTDNNHMDLRISTNGTSKRAGGSDYDYSGRFWDGAANTSLNNTGAEDRVFNRIGSAGSESVHFVLKCFSISDSTMRLSWTTKGFGQDSGGNARTIHSGCVFQGDSSKGRGVSFRTADAANFTAGEVWGYFFEDPAA
jgi:hypothetical protein